MLSLFSRVQLFATLWTVAHQAPLSMGFSREESWSGLPFPSPGNLLHLGIEPASLLSSALAGMFFTTSTTWEAQIQPCSTIKKQLNHAVSKAHTHTHTFQNVIYKVIEGIYCLFYKGVKSPKYTLLSYYDSVEKLEMEGILQS